MVILKELNMTQKDKELLKRAMQFVESRYPSDCPYYVQLVGNIFNEFKEQDMKQEDKELLIKDLCKRLPYGVVIQTWYDKRINIKCVGISVYSNVVELDIPEDDEARVFVDNVKPYLFPLSSLSDEQHTYLESLMEVVDIPLWGEILVPSLQYYEWLYAHHFDVNGLIEKGLAIDATNIQNIY
jgi:hypothetical protein